MYEAPTAARRTSCNGRTASTKHSSSQDPMPWSPTTNTPRPEEGRGSTVVEGDETQVTTFDIDKENGATPQEDREYTDARKRVQAKRDLTSHFVAYLVINAFLV